MPIRLFDRGRGPGDCLPTEPVPHVGIFYDVTLIVEVNEAVLSDGAVQDESSHNQNETAQNGVLGTCVIQ